LISAEQLLAAANAMGNTPYAEHLREVSRDAAAKSGAPLRSTIVAGARQAFIA
jgi:hypothetical protein